MLLCPWSLLAGLLTACFAAPTVAQDRPFAAFDGASDAVLHDPHDLAMGPDGRLYVADKFASRIAVFDPDTLKLVDVLADGMLPGVHDISFGPEGRVAVAITGASVVAVYDGFDSLDRGPSLAIRAINTEGTLAHSNGRIYAMSSGTGRIGAFDSTGNIALAEGHYGAHDLVEDLNGGVWVADNRARRLVRYSADLIRLQVLEGPEFGFLGPRYMDVTSFGHLVVADQESHRNLLIDPAAPPGAQLRGVLGNGSPGLGASLFDDPEGVVFDDGRNFISDSDNNRIVRYVVALN